MAITVNLWSNKSGEIKRFLERYYEKNVVMDEDVEQWIYVYRKPLDAVDLISAVMDNSDKYQIGMYLQVNEEYIHPITYENHNSVIRDIFHLFYEDSREIIC